MPTYLFSLSFISSQQLEKDPGAAAMRCGVPGQVQRKAVSRLQTRKSKSKSTSNQLHLRGTFELALATAATRAVQSQGRQPARLLAGKKNIQILPSMLLITCEQCIPRTTAEHSQRRRGTI